MYIYRRERACVYVCAFGIYKHHNTVLPLVFLLACILVYLIVRYMLVCGHV